VGIGILPRIFAPRILQSGGEANILSSKCTPALKGDRQTRLAFKACARIQLVRRACHTIRGGWVLLLKFLEWGTP